MPFEDFRKLFGLVLMTPINYKQYLSTKHTGFTVDVPANHRQAQYYRLNLKEPGQVSFSVIQAIGNLVPNLPKPPPPPLQSMITSTLQQSQVLQTSGNMIPAGGMQPPSSISPYQSPVRPLSMSGMSSQIPSTPIPPNNLYSAVRNNPGAPMNLPPTRPPTSIVQPSMPPTYGSPISAGQPPQSTRGLIRICGGQAPNQDPWLNTNPWPNPPNTQSGGNFSTGPGMTTNPATMAPPPPALGPFPPALNPGSNYRPSSSGYQIPGSPLPNIQMDPWKNTNPWSNPPTVGGNSGPAINPPSPYQASSTVITSQQQTTIVGAPASNLAGQRPITPTNASLLLPQLTPGLPPLQPQNVTGYITAPSPSQIGQLGQSVQTLGRPPLPPTNDPWLSRNPWGSDHAIGGLPSNVPASTVNFGIPPGIAGGTGYSPPPAPGIQLSYGPPYGVPYGPPSGSQVPFGSSGYSNPAVITGQGSGAMSGRTPAQQNPWFNTNPWSNPPTISAPPTGMRGGGGPTGLPIDPWHNTNPWNNPPTVGSMATNGGYFSQLEGGMTVRGGSRPAIPSPQGSQIYYDNAFRPPSPSLVNNQQPSNFYVPPPSQLTSNQSPLQPTALSQYTYVPQSTAQTDSWNNRNPRSGTPPVGPQQLAQALLSKLT
ncbi:unnamed protein product [Sphagnum balticum]